MQIDQLFSPMALANEIDLGFVVERAHPEFPELRILNYTERAAYERRWNEVTRITRGLIYNADTGKVLARPFAKFFNFGQEDVEYDLDLPILGVFDKMDGSLGILYEAPDHSIRIATRGSFASEQALHATEWLKDHHMAEYWLGRTPLFEIIYPENRIVLDYRSADKLVYLGNVDIETGTYNPPVEGYDGVYGYETSVRSYPEYGTLRLALEAAPRRNAEGFVIWLDHFTAVKVKQEDYVALHRIIFGLSTKEVWRQMVAGKYEEWVIGLPDEFYEWAGRVHDELNMHVAVKLHEADVAFDNALARSGVILSETYTREERSHFAHEATKYKDLTSLLFAMLDGRDPYPMVLKTLEPMGREGYSA